MIMQPLDPSNNRRYRSRWLGGSLAAILVLLVACAAPRGTIDPRYGDESRFFPDGGIVTTNFFNLNRPQGDRDGWDNLQSIVVDSQRRIIAVGTAVYQDGCRGELAVARYRASGVIDNTFGIDGDGTARFVYVNPDLYSTDGIAADVHGDAIVVMARQIFQYDCVCGAPCPENTARETTTVVRITSAGAIDANFGWRLFDFNTTNNDTTQGQEVAALPDGSVVACGIHYDPTGAQMALARFDSNGNLDAGFHSGSKWEPDFGGASSFCWDLAVQEVGKLIVGGGLNSPDLSTPVSVPTE